MSLLLDALKRAEQEKLAKGGKRSAPEKPRIVAAVPAPALELAPVGADAGAASPAGTKADAQAAQNLFAAKSAAAPSPPRRGAALWAAVGAIVLVVLGAGAYVWYSVSALRPQAVASARPRAAPTPAPATGQVAPAPADGAVTIAPFAVTAPPTGARTEAPSASTSAPTPASAPAKSLAAALLERRAELPVPPFKLARSTEKPRIAPEVTAGYEQLVAGNLAAARRSYAQALGADPSNLDARLGLATVEARSGNRNAALEHYNFALDIDPRNSTALAGLAALSSHASPEALEAQMHAGVSRYPRSAALRFTLGNLYASQSRWGEAQAEYYEAYRLEPGSADILYNLAVSLDHLGQSRLAAEHYARALEAARDRRGQFDAAAAARRLAELRP